MVLHIGGPSAVTLPGTSAINNALNLMYKRVIYNKIN